MIEIELRQYIAGLIDGLAERIKLLVDHERELRVNAAQDVAEALKRQAEEYKRRLDELNNENARILQVQEHSVTRDMFDSYRASQTEREERQREADSTWKREVNRQLDEQRGAANKQAATFIALVAIVGIALTLLSLVLRFLP